MIRKYPLSLKIAVTLFLFFLAILINLPFFWMLVTSFKTEDQAFSIPPSFLPTIFDLRNFVKAASFIPIGRYILNTLYVSFAVVALHFFTNSLAAYGIARIKFKGASVVFAILLGTMMVPPEVTMVPLYVIVKKFNMMNKYSGLILPFASSAFGILMLRQFFMGIPKELEDAAIIDGAGRMRIFFSIILPLSKPALFTMSIYSFLAVWNEYLWPLVIINDSARQMIQVGISQFVSGWETQWTMRMAASTIAVLPVIILFFFVQKQYVEGISVSGMKE